MAECKSLPLIPEVKIITETIPGRDGVIDYSAFNVLNRGNYKPRSFIFRCAFTEKIKRNAGDRFAWVCSFLTPYAGILIVDECPGVEWDAIITSGIDITNIAGYFFMFNITFQTAAFGREYLPGQSKWGILNE